MKIDREEASRIARLAHLELDDAALVRMAEEMTKTGELPVAKMKASKEDATPQLITSDDDRTITDPK